MYGGVCRKECFRNGCAVVDAGETRPIFSSTNIQNSLTQAHPEVLEAVDLSVEARAALRKSIYIPPCITEVSTFPSQNRFFTHLSTLSSVCRPHPASATMLHPFAEQCICNQGAEWPALQAWPGSCNE